MSIPYPAPEPADLHRVDDVSLNLVAYKDEPREHSAIEPQLKHSSNITGPSIQQKTFSISKLCGEEPTGAHNKTGSDEISSTQRTLVMSWRYDDNAPKITRKEVESAFKALSIDTSVTGTREFQHKIYIDCLTRVTKSQFGPICRYFESLHKNTQFFMRYDKVNDEEQATVFLGNVLGLTATDLAEAIEKRLGFVPRAIRIPINKSTEKPKPVAYVVCDSRDQAKELVENLQGAKLGLSNGIRTDLLVRDGESRVTLKPRRPRSESKAL